MLRLPSLLPIRNDSQRSAGAAAFNGNARAALPGALLRDCSSTAAPAAKPEEGGGG
jgi:hypothetical protein